MDKILLIVSVVLLIYSIYSTIKLIFDIIRSAVLIKKANKNSETIIKFVSPVYKIKNYLFAIGTELIMAYCMYKFSTVINPKFFLYYLSIIALLIIYLVRLIIHIIAVFKEKYAYLTADGLILFAGNLSFEKCRFVWESPDNPDELSDTLLVYPPNEKIPFAINVTEEIETAHLLTEINSINQ